jgi:hypothetical protein
MIFLAMNSAPKNQSPGALRHFTAWNLGSAVYFVASGIRSPPPSIHRTQKSRPHAKLPLLSWYNGKLTYSLILLN